MICVCVYVERQNGIDAISMTCSVNSEHDKSNVISVNGFPLPPRGF